MALRPVRPDFSLLIFFYIFPFFSLERKAFSFDGQGIFMEAIIKKKKKGKM